MQVRKQHLELDMEQQTGSKLGKGYVKAVYCHGDDSICNSFIIVFVLFCFLFNNFYLFIFFIHDITRFNAILPNLPTLSLANRVCLRDSDTRSHCYPRANLVLCAFLNDKSPKITFFNKYTCTCIFMYVWTMWYSKKFYKKLNFLKN